MGVDQTSQLIQLMLNSVLMMALCGSAAIGLMMRHAAIVGELRWLRPLYADILNGLKVLAPEQFWHLKTKLRRLRYQYWLVCIACWSANSALILCAGSTLLLALRTLVLLNHLIPISLMLFTAGAALLLLGIVLGLLSLVDLPIRELASVRFGLRTAPKEPPAAALLPSSLSSHPGHAYPDRVSPVHLSSAQSRLRQLRSPHSSLSPFKPPRA